MMLLRLPPWKMPTVTTDYRDKPRGAKTDIGAMELSTE